MMGLAKLGRSNKNIILYTGRMMFQRTEFLREARKKPEKSISLR